MSFVVDCYVHAPVVSVQGAEHLASRTDRWRVNQRQQIGGVFGHQFEEELLMALLEKKSKSMTPKLE